MNAPAPSNFSTLTPNFATTWDSTTLSWLKKCPVYYKRTAIDGWTSRHQGIHLRFGSLYASSLERFAHSKASGEPHDTAVLRMVRWALENSGEYVFDHDEETRRAYNPVRVGGVLHWQDIETGELCTDFTPTFIPWNPSPDPDANIKNRYTLIRTLVWNADERQTSPFTTLILANGKPAVELSFNFAFTEIDGEAISLSGHLDEVVEAAGDIYVRDDKAQPANCKVLGPNGWRVISDLKVGDLIAGADGKFHSITALYPKGIVSTFKISFDDGTSTYCAYDHLWNTSLNYTDHDEWVTRPLENVLDGFKRGQKLRIPNCEPIEFEDKTLPVDPYLLGALLGDGYFGGNSVAISTANPELVVPVQAAVDRMGDIFHKNPSANLVYTITRGRRCATLRGLKRLGLWGCLSRDKFIPAQYLLGSVWQRRALLQGLLDTDGSWDRVNRRYQTMSFRLAHGVADLIRSLGGYASVTLQSRDMFRVHLYIGERMRPIKRRYIQSITPAKEVENICIAIDSPDHLYLTDDYIVTHNTTKNALGASYFAQYTPNGQMSLYTVAGKIILDRPVRGVLVKAAQIGVNFSRFQTAQVPRPQAVLDEWMADTRFWIGQAKRFAEADHWPLNDNSCFLCGHKKICAVSPSHREAHLAVDFEKRERWNPLTVRGDI